MKSDYKYGSIEYRLEEAKESIDKALDLASRLRAETGHIKPIQQINKTGNLFASISDHYQTSYPTFDPNNENHIKKAVSNARKKLADVEGDIKIFHTNNLENIESNKKLAESVVNFMELVGISKEYSTWAYKTSRSANKTKTGHTAGYLEDIKRNIITNDGYEAEMLKAKSYRERIDKYEKESLAKIEETKKIKEKEDGYIRKVAKAMSLAEKYNLKPEEYPDNETLFSLVNESAKEEWLKENYPAGIELDQSACEECSSWIMGEQRCSCGNRRMYLEVEGDFFNGFYAYPMAD